MRLVNNTNADITFNLTPDKGESQSINLEPGKSTEVPTPIETSYRVSLGTGDEDDPQNNPHISGVPGNGAVCYRAVALIPYE